MFYQIFFSPQVKICAIIFKHGIYQMPNESPNVLRLRILNNYEISVKCLNPAPGQPSAPAPRPPLSPAPPPALSPSSQ